MSDDTIDGERTRVTIAIGGDDAGNYAAFAREFLSVHFGGCTVFESTGIWRTDGNGNPPYEGAIKEEDGRVITFVADRPRDVVADLVTDALREAHLPEQHETIQWVNVEYERVNVQHVDVTAS